MKIKILAILFMAMLVSSCEKENDDHTDHGDNETGTIEVVINHEWAMSGETFELDKELYHPMTGDTLKITKFRYYISNLKLKDMDGNWWSEEESYHLVDASVANSNVITLNDVPAKHYVEFSYTIGVDSARNVSGAQTGALSTANDMFWSWNTGYIMIKLEGTKTPDTHFSYHCGGFSGDNNVVTVKSTNFNGSHLLLEGHGSKTIELSANPARFWHGTSGVDSLPKMMHMPNATIKGMTDNFTGEFSFKSLK